MRTPLGPTPSALIIELEATLFQRLDLFNDDKLNVKVFEQYNKLKGVISSGRVIMQGPEERSTLALLC